MAITDQWIADVYRLAHFIVHRRVRHADLRDAARVLLRFESHTSGEIGDAVGTAIVGILTRGSYDAATERACYRLLAPVFEAAEERARGKREPR